MAGTHARLSPSGAHRWMACAGSIALESTMPDNVSAYASEGTVAHEIASKVLTDDDYVIPVGEIIEADGHEVMVTRAMAEFVEDYVKLVQEYAEGGTLLVEQRVDFSRWVGAENQFGTSDVIIVKKRAMTVIDLKYGMGVKVDAQDNPQLAIYALGAYDVASLIDEVDEVTMVIHMPRLNHVSEWTIPIQQLIDFGAEVREAAARVEEALTLYATPEGLAGDAAWALQPGEKQCRFCKAKAVCPALREAVMETINGSVSSPATPEDFAQFLIEPPTAEDGDNWLSVVAGRVGLIEDWCKGVRAEVERRLLNGQSVPDWKLVEGKLGDRAWKDSAKVEELMKKSYRMKNGDMYDQKLISPTTAEKRLKKTNPVRWEKLQEHIERKPGKPSVAPATDKRPALVVSNNADDLRELANTDTE